ncbi:MAG TPA: extracellular solute-binding protein, partial [Pirellulales bacterium]|nr:extracellular solute-binding protein [Pirellulales bacterium]
MSPTPASDLVWHGGRLGGRLGFFAVLVALVSIVAGCGEKPKLSSSSEKSAQNVVLGVVGDAALADSIGRLKAEWHAVTGNTLEVVPLESTAFLVGAGGNESSSDSAVFKPDALVVPATELGTLAEADRLAPVPLDVRASAAAAWSDIFLLAQQGAVWGDDIWAVPLGTPQLTLLYRRDLFDELGRTPPTTWAEYQTLVEFFANRDKLAGSAQSSEAPPADAKWYGTLEPLGGGWGAKTLLARAACYAKHRDNFSVLFTIEDFKPLVDGPPFVRALEELVAANRGSEAATAERLALDPAGVRTAFFAGQSAMALSWPTAAGSPQP